MDSYECALIDGGLGFHTPFKIGGCRRMALETNSRQQRGRGSAGGYRNKENWQTSAKRRQRPTQQPDRHMQHALQVLQEFLLLWLSLLPTFERERVGLCTCHLLSRILREAFFLVDFLGSRSFSCPFWFIHVRCRRVITRAQLRGNLNTTRKEIDFPRSAGLHASQ